MRGGCGSSQAGLPHRRGSATSLTHATLLRKMMVRVRWYNFRPYASRTYISKVANLPHLRDAPERERHALSRVRHGTHHKSRCEIEKS